MRKLFGRASVFLFAALAVFMIGFGALYASVNSLLWFHAAAVPEPALDAIRPLYFALMKLIGAASAGLGLLALYAALGPLRRGAPLAALMIAAALALPVVMAAYVAETLARETGAPTSWHIMGVLLAINALAFIAHSLSGSEREPA